jgi:DNA-binding NarL/FixJ family response regulator
VVDIETAIKFAKFEPKERKILNMWMDGYTQTEIAEAVYDYQPNVNKAINKCIRRLQYILLYLNPYS